MKDIAIKEHHLYVKAYRSGERANTKHLSVYVLRDWGAKKQMLMNPEKKYINRIGLSVSKKVGGAVQRNRVKRIIRAGLSDARAYGELRKGNLIVISARDNAHEVNSTVIGEELISAFQKLQMYKNVNKTEAENK